MQHKTRRRWEGEKKKKKKCKLIRGPFSAEIGGEEKRKKFFSTEWHGLFNEDQWCTERHGETASGTISSSFVYFKLATRDRILTIVSGVGNDASFSLSNSTFPYLG